MRFKLFGNTGLRVSELCLGTMTFGEEWGEGANKEESKRIFDLFLNAGGNFLDTANFYTGGTSERFLAEFIQSERDNLVLSTKYTLAMNPKNVNECGNHRKNLIQSVERSLKRLNTDAIDLLWLHAWDYTTPPEEVMRSLNDLVRSGKVHYIGFSDTPAWIVAQANTLADLRGWTKLSGLQIEYSLIERTPERDLLPMAKAFNMTTTAWSPLGMGCLTGKYLGDSKEGRFANRDRHDIFSTKVRSERAIQITKKVVDIADEVCASPASVALAWIQRQSKHVIPIVGARKVTQLEDNLNCLKVELSPEHLKALNEVSAIQLGFPHDFLDAKRPRSGIYGENENRILDLHRHSF